MFRRVLRRMRQRVRESQYVITLHADEEIDNDGLTIYDVERVILTGRIVERQEDVVTAEWKYRVRGATAIGDLAEMIVKINSAGELVIITVYLLEQ